MLTDKWGDYGLGVLAVAALAYVIVQLVNYLTNTKKAASPSFLPPQSTIPPEVVVALDRNSDAISRLTHLLEMQFEFERERRAEDRARIDRLQATVDRLMELSSKQQVELLQAINQMSR